MDGNWLNETKWSLPPDLAMLPSIEAEHWCCVDADPQLFIEGPSFDREGNLFVCCSVPVPGIAPRVFKITPEGESSVFAFTGDASVMGLAIHQDGRLFIACMEEGIMIMSPQGEILEQFVPAYRGERLRPNDLTFHKNGNLYFTDFRGDCQNPCGGIYRLLAESGYRELDRVVSGMIFPNGLCFKPDWRALWIGESGRNAVWQVSLNSDGMPGKLGVPLCCLYQNTGCAMPDGCRMDAAGYYYQALNHGGRILIFNAMGVPVGNVIVPRRGEQIYDMTPNLAIRPNTREAYMLASGSEGVHIFRFPTFAPASVLYSHM